MTHLTVIDGGRDDSWQSQGECNGVDQSIMFPEQGQSNAPARKLCAGCVVRRQCLEHAIDHHEEYGIWGGTTPRERQAIRRNRRGVA
jgi:WhiB family redox-sensing transcriptional regulator